MHLMQVLPVEQINMIPEIKYSINGIIKKLNSMKKYDIVFHNCCRGSKKENGIQYCINI